MHTGRVDTTSLSLIEAAARVAVLLVAVTVAMVCVKFAAREYRSRPPRALALLAYASVIAVPAALTVSDFTATLPVAATIAYTCALAAGVASMRSTYAVRLRRV